MTNRAKGKVEVKSWDEQPFKELEDGAKVTRALVSQAFHGDIEGQGEAEYLMTYADEKCAEFVGVQCIDGRIGDRRGRFVLQLSGTYDGDTAKAKWTVVEGAATGDLRGISGKGSFKAPHGPNATFTLNYELP